jgi:hypothetical protein
MYAVYFCEHMRDGEEDGAKVVETVEEALSIINRIGNGFAGSNYTFRLFKLGKEISLNREVVEEPKPVEMVKRAKFSVTHEIITRGIDDRHAAVIINSTGRNPKLRRDPCIVVSTWYDAEGTVVS